MIIVKNSKEISLMRNAGAITKNALNLIGSHVKPGVTTLELDKIAFDYIKKQNARPSFLNYMGFPYSICASVNDEVVHGFPGNRVLKEGDIVSIDVGAQKDGYHGDCAKTFFVGEIKASAKKLVEVTRQSFYEGIKFAKEGYRIGDISSAIAEYVESFGYSIVVDLTGHGIGKNLHEDPSVPNSGNKGKGPRLVKGMTIAIEPMVNEGQYKVTLDNNNWTYKTKDGSLSAHYENTVLITDGEPEILTKADL